MAMLEGQLEDSSEAVYGAGTFGLTAWSYADRMDEAGPFEARIPAADANSYLLEDASGYSAKKKTLRALAPYHSDLGTSDAGAGIIDRVEKGDAQLYIIAGNSLMAELTGRSVGNLLLSDGAGGPIPGGSSPGPVEAIMDYAPPGWTSSGTPNQDVLLQFNGESVLEALRKVTENGGHFRLAHDANGRVLREIEWLGDPEDSGLRAEDGGDAMAMAGDDSVCQIAPGSFKQVASSANLYTRYVNVRGGGNEDAALSLLYTTRNGAPGTGILTHDYTSLGGITLHIEANDPAGCYIKIDAAETLYGRWEKPYTNSDIAFKTPGTLHAVSNQLFDATVTSLLRAAQPKYDYQLELVGLRRRIRPFQTFVVNYHGYIQTENGVLRWLDLTDKVLLLLAVDGVYDQAGARTTKVTVTDATTDYWPVTADRVLAKVVSQMRSLQSHLQPAATALSADTAPAANVHVATLTMSAASSHAFTDTNVTAASAITLTPVNPSAGVLMASSRALYVSAQSTGSFTLATADGTAAAGTEIFRYVVVN